MEYWSEDEKVRNQVDDSQSDFLSKEDLALFFPIDLEPEMIKEKKQTLNNSNRINNDVNFNSNSTQKKRKRKSM